MKILFRTLFFMCLLFASVNAFAQCRGNPYISEVGVDSSFSAEKIFYQSESFNSILEKARKNHKPVIIEFRATWCAPCVKMENTTFKNSRIKRYLKDNFYTYGVDVDEYIDLDLVTRFGVKSCPTFVFLDYKAKEIKKIYGFQSSNNFYKELTLIANIVEKKKKWWHFW